MKTSGLVFAFAIVISTIFIIGDWWRLGSALPSLSSGGSQRILDRYGQEIRHALSVNGERRYVIPLEKVPDQVRYAFIQAEDKRFYSHHGVDWRALFRGIVQSVLSLRKVSGGSTITIQLVRTAWPEIQGLIHKPAQLLQALQIELRYSKGEILAQYLNTIPFGSKISGVGAACRYFFDKSCDQLSNGQISALAILPRNPTYYLKKTKLLVQRRNALLEKLLVGSEALVLEQAKSEAIIFSKTNPEFYAPHLTEKILEEKKDQVIIQTTLDLGLQKRIQELLLAETLNRRGTGDSGAVLVLDNKSGEVLAYVGSPDFFDPAHGMVDGVQVLRSPGSALKPFIYELALENNWTLSSIIPDIPMLFSTQRSVYEPNNYGANFSGPRTIREALANSKNLPALYMTSQLGEVRVLDHLKRFGFSSLNQEASYYGVGLALGNGEVSLWDLTKAFSTLARLGISKPSTYYKGTKQIEKRIVPEETAFLIADVLRDPEARQEEFGRYGPLEFDYEVGVKTGTSNDYRDNWTVGFTKEVTLGVWRGNANSTPLAQKVSASRGTGPLFHKIMDVIHSYRSPMWLKQPKGVHQSRVCSVSGQKPGQYCELTRLEYHMDGHEPKKECEFHKHIIVPNCHQKSVGITYVQLPKEYDEWVKGSKIASLENQLQEKCGSSHFSAVFAKNENKPMIIEPLDKTNYAIDPTIPLSHQEIRIALRNIGKNDSVQIFLNDQPIQKQVGEDEYFWPIQRGQFKFYVRKNGMVSNVVNVQVR